MKTISRLLLPVTLVLVLFTAACAGQQGSPTATAQATFTPTIQATNTSTITLTVSPTTTVTAGIPVTGPTTASLVCQFCMEEFTHALVVIPAAATFTVLSPAPSASTPTDINTGCTTVDRFRDQQIVLCRAPSNASLTVNVCQGNDCHQFTVRLQSCPPPTPDSITPTWTATFTPAVSLTPTLTPPVSSPTGAIPTSTSGTSVATVTAGSATPTITVSPTMTP